MVNVKDLLSNGYFPRELPPAFSTKEFAEAVVGSSKAVNQKFLEKRENAELLVHNLVRSGGVRRDLGIPNPLPYAHLCQFISHKWQELSTLTSRSTISLTKPVSMKSERAISAEHSLDERIIRRVNLRSKSRFVVRADISRFYPSIYTHSLPWAVHTKATVKQAMAERGSLKSLWADELDTHLRNMNSKQTVGIPIGPDCSLLVAEVLLSAVDEELQNAIVELNGIRFIDDYEFGVRTYSEGEKIISQLQTSLNHYGLALNPAKTSITQLPEPFEPLWTSHLRTFIFREAGRFGQRNDLTAYFDFAFDCARKHRDEGVLKYAIPRLNGIEIDEDNWTVYESILSQCVIVEPATLPQVCEQIEFYNSLGYTINQDLWGIITNQVVLERLPLGQASEAVWAMWLMSRLKCKLCSEAAKVVDFCEDSLAALMGLGLVNAGLADALVNLNRFAEPDELKGRNWLLCYEGVHQGWLVAPSKRDTFEKSTDFTFLHDNNVSFFDIEAEHPEPRRRNKQSTTIDDFSIDGWYDI